MGWLTSLPGGYQVSKRSVTEKHWTFILTQWGYNYRTITTTVSNYDAMTENAANTAAAAMNGDTTGPNGAGTKTTAAVERLNEAAAYRVVKTSVETSEWSSWIPV